MKAKDVKIGEVYRVKVSGKLADVRITRESERSVYSRYGITSFRVCWYGVNLATGRDIFIRSASRLRYPVVASIDKKAWESWATKPETKKEVAPFLNCGLTIVDAHEADKDAYHKALAGIGKTCDKCPKEVMA